MAAIETQTLRINTEQKSSVPTHGDFENLLCFSLLILANLGLVVGKVPAVNLMYLPDAVSAGEWWRALTWPLIHVSRYHLLLDGVTFLFLWHGLAERSRTLRWLYAAATIAGSLLFPLLASPEIKQLGLCGMSGPAHGLFAITALELILSKKERTLGILLFSGLMAKTAWEILSGQALFQGLHLGDIGHPILTTHAGGVIGAVLMFALIAGIRKTVQTSKSK